MVTLTNARKKLLKSLDTSKGRRQSGLFIAQGAKCVLDTLPHFKAEAIYALEDWACAHPEVKAKIVNRSDMKDISTFGDSPRCRSGVFHSEFGDARARTHPTLSGTRPRAGSGQSWHNNKSCRLDGRPHHICVGRHGRCVESQSGSSHDGSDSTCPGLLSRRPGIVFEKVRSSGICHVP